MTRELGYCRNLLCWCRLWCGGDRWVWRDWRRSPVLTVAIVHTTAPACICLAKHRKNLTLLHCQHCCFKSTTLHWTLPRLQNIHFSRNFFSLEWSPAPQPSKHNYCSVTVKPERGAATRKAMRNPELNIAVNRGLLNSEVYFVQKIIGSTVSHNLSFVISAPARQKLFASWCRSCNHCLFGSSCTRVDCGLRAGIEELLPTSRHKTIQWINWPRQHMVGRCLPRNPGFYHLACSAPAQAGLGCSQQFQMILKEERVLTEPT